MYTSHPSQPTSRGGRPEYYTTQLNTWGMTGNRETFRQGATAYRNARDWVNEQRDEVIKRANDRANDSQTGAPAVDSSFGPVSSFASEDPLEEPYTIEPLSQESQTLLNEDSNTTANPQESETSTDEPVLDHRLPAKRSSGGSKRSHQSQRKRRNAGKSSSTGHSC